MERRRADKGGCERGRGMGKHGFWVGKRGREEKRKREWKGKDEKGQEWKGSRCEKRKLKRGKDRKMKEVEAGCNLEGSKIEMIWTGRMSGKREVACKIEHMLFCSKISAGSVGGLVINMLAILFLVQYGRMNYQPACSCSINTLFCIVDPTICTLLFLAGWLQFSSCYSFAEMFVI